MPEQIEYDGTNAEEILGALGGEDEVVRVDPPMRGKHSLAEGVLRIWNPERDQHDIVRPGDSVEVPQ